ncbi:MAG: hypothetical protein NTW86_29360 [Candidatus Sumerlaeota bacterium]|nr:hypothetical protein [Candidatus Sumerlaeota bacterium]
MVMSSNTQTTLPTQPRISGLASISACWAKRLRRALRLPDAAAPSLFFEQYDSAPILDLKNEGFLATLRSTFPGGLPL